MMTRLPLKALFVSLFLVAVFLMATTSSAAAPAQGPQYTMHVVRPGETLYSIARAYGVGPYQIAMANHLVNPNMLWVGQQLVVPGGYGYTPPYRPYPSTQVYVVRPGDTLFSIAMRFGTSVNAVAMANNISNPNVLFAGQKLVIPDGHPAPEPPPYHPAPEPPPYQPHPGYPPKKPAVKKPELKPAVCNPQTKITFPRKGEVLDGPGTFDISGTANIDDLQFYKLELGMGKAPFEFFSIDDVKTKPIVNGYLLRDWNTGALPEGEYILRLTVVDNSGQFPPPCEVRIRIDHPEGVDP